MGNRLLACTILAMSLFTTCISGQDLRQAVLGDVGEVFQSKLSTKVFREAFAHVSEKAKKRLIKELSEKTKIGLIDRFNSSNGEFSFDTTFEPVLFMIGQESFILDRDDFECDQDVLCTVTLKILRSDIKAKEGTKEFRDLVISVKLTLDGDRKIQPEGSKTVTMNFGHSAFIGDFAKTKKR